MTAHILDFTHLLFIPFFPEISLSSTLHGLAIASPYNPIFLLCYGRFFFQGSFSAFSSVLGALGGYGSFFFFIHQGLTGPLFVWYKMEPLLCLLGAIALNLSALNFCTSQSMQRLTTRLGTISGEGPALSQFGSDEAMGQRLGESSGDSAASQSYAVPPMPSLANDANYQKIFLFHWLLAWTNPASLCLGSQSLIVESDMGLMPCFLGMIVMVSLCSMLLWIINQGRYSVTRLRRDSVAPQVRDGSMISPGSNSAALGSVPERSQLGYTAGLGRGAGPRINLSFLRPWVLKWIPYWVIGLTVTSLSQMTWHLFVHYPFEYTQLSPMQRNFDTEVPKSVRRHDPFLRLQDMMRRYPGVKDMEFSQTQRERAYIRYNSYPLNVITKSVRMAILSCRNPKYISREPYEIYHLQQLKDIFDTQTILSFTSPRRSLGPSRGSAAPQTSDIHARIWKNKEKGNPQFSYSRALTLQASQSSKTVSSFAPDSEGGFRWLSDYAEPGVGASVMHDDLAFLMTLFTDTASLQDAA